MSKYLQIQIPEPCHENWTDMEPAKQGRHCNLCRKNVTDFTLMSDDELARFFKNNKESVCGRFHRQQLDADILIPAKKIPWLKYFFQIAIPAFLFSATGTAQGKVAVVQKHVVDKKKVKNEIITEPVKFNITATGVPLEVPIKNEEQSFTGVLGGAISVVRIKKGPVSFPLISNLIRSNSFAVFPNPVVANSNVTIKFKKAIASDQTVQVFDQRGTLILSDMITLKENNIQKNLILNQVPAGNYIISITDNKTHKFSSQQFIVL